MTATEVIREIEALPPAGQAEVVRFARQLDKTRQLSGEELGALAEQMVASTDPRERADLEEAIIRGFYGGTPHA